MLSTPTHIQHAPILPCATPHRTAAVCMKGGERRLTARCGDIVHPQLEHQIALLSKGAEPSVRPSALDLLIGRVRDRGMADLADNARAAFNVYQAIKRGPPPTLKSMAKAVTAPRMGILADQISRAKGNKGLQHFDALASGHADEDSDFEELEPATYLTPKPSGPKPRDPSARPGSTASNRPGSAASGVASLGDWDMSRYGVPHTSVAPIAR